MRYDDDQSLFELPYIKRLEKSRDFKKITSTGRVIVRYTAEWCRPCKNFEKRILPRKDMLRFLKEKDITLLFVDVDDFRELAEEAGVRNLPHVEGYLNGKKVGSSWTNNNPKTFFYTFFQDE
ncbi:MAG: thioredoxin family protein [archaeon]